MPELWVTFTLFIFFQNFEFRNPKFLLNISLFEPIKKSKAADVRASIWEESATHKCKNTHP